jgi:hypothetical protein
MSKIEFRPFEKAREFVHTLKLKNQDEWRRRNQLRYLTIQKEYIKNTGKDMVIS